MHHARGVAFVCQAGIVLFLCHPECVMFVSCTCLFYVLCQVLLFACHAGVAFSLCHAGVALIYHAGVVFVSVSCRRCHAVVYHARVRLPVLRVGGVLPECHEGVMRATGALMRKGGQSKDSSRRELRRKFAEGVSGDEGSFGLHGGVEIHRFPLVLVLML